MRTPTFTELASIAPLAEKYDAFILDLWGVIHDGQQLYPNALTCLEKLRAAGKKIVFLSNAPRRAAVAQAQLTRMGVGAHLYDALITSGEVAYKALAHPESHIFKPRGKHYIYIGLERDQAILEGLHYEEVMHAEHAQFVLLNHYQHDHQPIAELMPLLKECITRDLPLLCINPDREIVRLSGEHVHCAGEIAHEYHMMGGHVTHVGKPHPAVYEECFKHFGHIPKSHVVAIGDNLATDIKGAHHMGIASVLVTSGILKEELSKISKKDIEQYYKALFAKEEITPTSITSSFVWK